MPDQSLILGIETSCDETAAAVVRSGVPEGTIFLATGIAAESANALTEPTVEISKP